ncbi:MAG: hypothetical protein CMD36_02260 [Flavobacteriales bacterium]|nr:hypothetical protein [Flavobacteriales bacterium]
MTLKSFFGYYFAKYIVKKNNTWINAAVSTQNKQRKFILDNAKNTKFGKDHGFSKILNYTDWKKSVPIRDYEGLKPYIDLVVNGENDILWPGKPIYFCKTSGTTSGSKYIPISKQSMKHHIIAARDAILAYIYETKNTSIINGKMIFIQGSPVLSTISGILTGRLSGIVAHHTPWYLKRNQLPTLKTNSINSWEEKIDAICNETKKADLRLISGIPPWVQMYFEKLIEKTGKNIASVFPKFSLFIHGGVNFKPYKKTFEKLIGKSVDSVELYPASEGFIAYQNSLKEKGLLLCVNHGIFYEFIVADSFYENKQKRISLEDVEIGVNYVIILNTTAGLYGYNIGDTIKFVSLDPYKIIVTGRIKHFTSAFGEHVIGEEVDFAINKAINKLSAEIVEFHVAPMVNPTNGLPYHEWLIEFESPPKDLLLFEKTIDDYLQEKNSYYKDLIKGKVLRSLKITLINKNGFRKYMQSVGKLGGQNKVPRLSNNRKIADKLLCI